MMVALSAPAMAARLELANDPTTGGPERFASKEIHREAETKGINSGDDPQATRVSLSVDKDTKATAQSYRIPVQNEGGRRFSIHRHADLETAIWCLTPPR